MTVRDKCQARCTGKGKVASAFSLEHSGVTNWKQFTTVQARCSCVAGFSSVISRKEGCY